MFHDELRPCIISYIDLIDIKNMIQSGKEEAVKTMQSVHRVVYGQVNEKMPNHAHAYTWNDSVLLLAYINSNLQGSVVDVMKEVNALKKKIDEINNSYCICVEGMPMAEPLAYQGNVFVGNSNQPKYTHIKASSMAFANCFEVEKELSKHKMGWYVDGRINDRLNLKLQCKEEEVKLLPDNGKRKIYMYKNYLW